MQTPSQKWIRISQKEGFAQGNPLGPLFSPLKPFQITKTNKCSPSRTFPILPQQSSTTK
jgi:hypothetical protein